MKKLHFLWIIMVFISCKNEQEKEPLEIFINPIVIGVKSKTHAPQGPLFCGMAAHYELVRKTVDKIQMECGQPQELILNSGPKSFIVNKSEPATFFTYILDKNGNVVNYSDSITFGITNELNHKKSFKGVDLGFINILEYMPEEVTGYFRVTAKEGLKLFSETKYFQLSSDNLVAKPLIYEHLVELADNSLYFRISQTGYKDKYGNSVSNGGLVRFILKGKDWFSTWNGMVINGMISMKIQNPSKPGQYQMYLVQGNEIISDVRTVYFKEAFRILNTTIDKNEIMTIGPIVNSLNDLVPDGDDVIVTLKGDHTWSTERRLTVKNGLAVLDLKTFESFTGEQELIIDFHGVIIKKKVYFEGHQ